MEGRPLEDTADTDLVGRAQRGDVGAYECLVRRYQDLAFRTAYLVTGDPSEAQDAAQEALVKAFYALPRFRPGAPFRPWLLRIAANEARNRRIAAGRRAGLALRAAAEPGAVSDEDCPSGGAAPSPEAAALADEQRAHLVEAINGLRADDRLAIAYRYFFDLSEAEMAAALGCARGTVKSRLSRALQRLRERLAAGSGTIGGLAAAAADAPHLGATGNG